MVNGLYRDTDCTATINFPRQMLSGSFVAEQSAQQTLARHGLNRDNLIISVAEQSAQQTLPRQGQYRDSSTLSL